MRTPITVRVSDLLTNVPNAQAGPGPAARVLRRRPDLKLVVSSATMDAEAFGDFFRSAATDDGDAAITVALLSVEGRMFPVGAYASPCSGRVRALARLAHAPGGGLP